MKGSRQKVVVDSGFWIALYNPEKEYEKNVIANVIIDLIEDSEICIPWPTMYEFVNSKFARNRDRLDQFQRVITRDTITKIDDATYREVALENIFKYHSFGLDDISLVDEVIKLMLVDTSLKIDYFVSFDQALTNFATSQGINTDLSR